MMLQQPSASLEERLSHLEKTLPLLARLNEQQTLFDEIQKLNSNLDELVQSVERFAKAQSLENAEFKNKYELLALNAAKLSVELSDLNNSRIQHEKEHKNDLAICHDVHEDFAHKTELLNNSVNELRMLVANMPTKAEMRMLNSDMMAKLVEPHNELLRLNNVVKDATQAIEGLSLQHTKMATDMNAYAVTLELLQKKYRDAMQDNYAKCQDFFDKQNRKCEDIEKAVNGIYENIAKIKTVDADQLKEEMIAMVDPVKLEANIAGLRSANNLSKITILEKKIEQVYLLINKIELAK